MHIAMVGTRGVPARYGGFETAVEEVGRRLAASGHRVTVYCRGGDPAQRTHLGMELVHRPAAQRKTLETLSHTARCLPHLLHTRPDATLMFNAANAPLLPALRSARLPVATHVDGLEWQRAKWAGAGRRYYQQAERLAVRWSDALIADAEGIAAHYRETHRAETVLLTYGAPLRTSLSPAPLDPLGLVKDGYHLVVARFEPENHVREAVAAHVASRATMPLVVVGAAPYADDYTREVERAAAGDPRVRMIGSVWDQDQLDALYAHARTYVHGHSVGGTNPSLLRAAGAGAPVLARDVVFNREVLGAHGRYWATDAELAALLEEAEAHGDAARSRGEAGQAEVVDRYDWDDVAQGYADLCRALADGTAVPPRPRRRPRRGAPARSGT